MGDSLSHLDDILLAQNSSYDTGAFASMVIKAGKVPSLTAEDCIYGRDIVKRELNWISKILIVLA